MDQPEQLNIRDESTDEERRFQLYVGDCRRGLVTLRSDRRVRLHWQTAGPASLNESRIWIQGLLELLLIAEQLEEESKHGQVKPAKKRRRHGG